MSKVGSAATHWISCDIVLINADQQWKSQNGTMPESEVCHFETVAELDTGSSELGLPPEVIQKLKLVTLGSPIEIESPLDGKKTEVAVFGPVIIDFCGKQIAVPVHELKHTRRVLLGLEPAQRLKIDVDWIHSKVILPSTAYTHKAYLIGPQDLLNLFGHNGHTIEALQQQHKLELLCMMNEFERHIRGIQEILEQIDLDYSRMVRDFSKLISTYKDDVSNLENVFINATTSHRLLKLQERFQN
ncbi:unnamed protein product [Rotaria sp. Silwood1]|nr:unnamed protein product [Rotaria sp. Silwood1]